MTITYLSRAEIDSAILAKVEATLGSVGFPFAGVEVRIVDGLGSDLPSGHLGEVLVRGPVVMQGYWGDPKSTEQTVQAGWLRTGDVGVIDDSGRLILRDREKDLIISGGLNIYPREVEEILIRHPGVREAAVVGQHDSQWGEIVVAFVAMHRGHASASTELDALCLDNIARYKRPKAYCFLPDLPKNSYGKILKRELRERLHMRSTDPNAPRVHNIEQS
jgi:long-chain acyl-CoA synthetase